MNLLDLGLLALLFLITLRGYFRGLFQELAVLAGLAGGILAAAYGYTHLANHLKPWLGDFPYTHYVSFGVILVAVYWLTRLVAHGLQRLLFHLYLDILDRWLGAFFALVKGALLLGFTLLFLSVVIPKNSKLFNESRLVPYLKGTARQAMTFLPPEFKQRFHDYLRDWHKPHK